jgi:hypothetical protein
MSAPGTRQRADGRPQLDIRDCRAEGCIGRHRANQLMCRRHWLGLPRELRTEVLSAYREDGVLSQRFVDASDACFEYWSRGSDG